MTLSDQELNVLAERYIEIFRKQKPSSQEVFEEYRMVDIIIEQYPEQGIKLIKYLILMSKNEEEVAYIAAGPLEQFIFHHANTFQETLRTLVRQIPKLRHAMKHVWHRNPNTPAGKLMKNLEYLWK